MLGVKKAETLTELVFLVWRPYRFVPWFATRFQSFSTTTELLSDTILSQLCRFVTKQMCAFNNRLEDVKDDSCSRVVD